MAELARAAELLSRYANKGVELSTLEQVIHVAGKGTRLAIVNRNLIVEELAESGNDVRGIHAAPDIRLLRAKALIDTSA